MEKIATDTFSFERLRTERCVYVDKTAILKQLADGSIGTQFFIARPRRFGKSLAVSTLQCLFEGRRDLFRGLAIEPDWDWTKKWPVLHLDMGSCQAATVERLWEKIGSRLKIESERLGIPLREGSPSVQFEFLIEDLAKRNREEILAAAKAHHEEPPENVRGQMVLLVDEYDKPLLGHLGKSDVNDIRDALKEFYSVIKTCEGQQRFAFITGVSKFSKVSIFSDLNNLNEFSMDVRFATLFGYTHEEVKSNVELHLEEGATILFSDNPKDYLPAVRVAWEGVECYNYSPLVYAFGATNVALTGTGTLRAYEGEWKDTFWYPWVWQENGIKAARLQLYTWGATDYPVEKREIWKMKNANTRPHFVQFNRCRNVRWENFKVRNSPFWTLHLYQCEDAYVCGLDVCAHGNNNDGIDIEMSRDVLVENCTFDQGDDGIVIKSGRNRDAWRLHTPTENILIRNCRIKNAGGLLVVGSEISGGVRNVRMVDCRAETPNRVFYLKTNRRRGGTLENIVCENVTCRSARESVFEIATDVLYEWADFPDYENRPTAITNIVARNIRVGRTKDRVKLVGDPASPPCGIRVENVTAETVDKADREVKNVCGYVEKPE